MLVRATLILIALFVGYWMVFDGIHVLIYGRFFGPEKPGPWSFTLASNSPGGQGNKLAACASG
jgi:hypothetical protein